MAKTIVGVFDESSAARTAARELQTAGIPENHIRVTSNDEAGTGKSTNEGGWTDKIVHFFESMFDADEDKRHAHTYAEAWRRGQYLVVADVEESQVDTTVSILGRHGTVDIDRRVEHWKNTGYSGAYDRDATPYTAEQREKELATLKQNTQAVPVIQEELAVGKHVVQRGGVRIHSYVKEQPVEEIVRLREERVNVSRRAVDRPVSAADASFQDRTIEVTAQGEEAVAEKRARVVEEVVVGKEVQEREKRVSDTVRRKDVEVEQIEGSKTQDTARTANQTPRR